MKKHYFFDLDNTITESRSVIKPNMVEVLNNIKGDIIVISGAEKSRMEKQLVGVDCFIMGQSGSENDYWTTSLSEMQYSEIKSYCQQLQERFNYCELFFQDRGSQVTLGFLDPNSDLEVKSNFDKDKSIRRQILKEIPFISLAGVEVKIAGSTSLDFIDKENSKGNNIQKLIEYNGWKNEDCVFYGDALEEGGNDYSVVGVIETISIKNPQDLWEKLK